MALGLLTLVLTKGDQQHVFWMWAVRRGKADSCFRGERFRAGSRFDSARRSREWAPGWTANGSEQPCEVKFLREMVQGSSYTSVDKTVPKDPMLGFRNGKSHLIIDNQRSLRLGRPHEHSSQALRAYA